MIGAINFGGTLVKLAEQIYNNSSPQGYIMILISFVLLYLAIAKDFEPSLLLPIAFGMLLINLPGAYEYLYDKQSGIFYFLNLSVEHVIVPPLIFLGIGAMTDFGPLIANPKTMIVGAAAQVGIYFTFVVAILFGYVAEEAATISIIGGADGPSTIYLMQKYLNVGDVSKMQSAIVIAAYSYMALIPVIQPPVMKLLTTKKERLIRMDNLRTVSKKEKIIFPILVTTISGIVLPDSLPLIGMLMLGNLMKESMAVERLTEAASNSLINIVTIFLGLVVGSKAIGANFLTVNTAIITGLGLLAFIISTAGGIISVKIINLFSKKKMNPLIGNAGVSAIPMAARISQKVGREYDSSNFLLMHAMGANVAGSIGSAMAAGVFLLIFKATV